MQISFQALEAWIKSCMEELDAGNGEPTKGSVCIGCLGILQQQYSSQDFINEVSALYRFNRFYGNYPNNNLFYI